MLRASDKRLFTSGQLKDVFGGRLGGYPDGLPGHMDVPPVPPVSGYIAHYDASDESTVTQVTGLVTAWADKTGSFNVTATGQVIYVRHPTLFNNRCVIWLDGGSSGATLTSGAGMSDMTSSAFWVGMHHVGGAIRTLLCSNADGGNQLRLTNAIPQRLETAKNDIAIMGTQSNAGINGNVPFVAGQILTTSDVTHYTNLTSETDAHGQTFTGGLTLVIGASPTTVGAQRVVAHIAEIILYNTSLSSGDAESVIGYLMGKWGIT